jgi:hypothetical protein
MPRDRFTPVRAGFAMMAIVVGLVVLMGGLRVFWLSRSGRTTRGEVITKRRLEDPGPPYRDEYLVTYQFRTGEGRLLSSEEAVAPEFWNMVKEGDPIVISYVPSYPDVHWQGDIPDPVDREFAAAGLALGLAISGWGALKLKRMRPGLEQEPPPFETSRISPALIKALVLTTAGALMAEFARRSGWPADVADPAMNALGLSGAVAVALGVPITMVAALFGSGPVSNNRKRFGLSVGTALMIAGGAWLGQRVHGLPASGRLTLAEGIPMFVVAYLFLVGTVIVLAGLFRASRGDV